MGIVGKIRKLITGEPEDPAEKAEWMAERARIKAERIAVKSQAMSDLPIFKPPE